jgi:hypothetical protein
MRNLILLLMLSQAACAQTADWRVTVLANSIDSGMASELYATLQARGIAVVKADAKTFDVLKDSPFVIILGGQNSPEGVGKVSANILSQKEQDSLLNPGVSALFYKSGTFSPDQKIYILAGNEATDTKRAWQANADRLAQSITGGLKDLLIFAPTELIIARKSNLLSLSFPVNVTNNGFTNITKTSINAYLNGGIKLTTDPMHFDLPAGQSTRVLVKLNPRNVSTGDVVASYFGGTQAMTRLNVTENEKVPVCNICEARDAG